MCIVVPGREHHPLFAFLLSRSGPFYAIIPARSESLFPTHCNAPFRQSPGGGGGVREGA